MVVSLYNCVYKVIFLLYYVHCFAHQLQLALVACAKTHSYVSGFLGMVNMLVNFIRYSNKRQELLQDKQVAQFAKQLRSM